MVCVVIDRDVGEKFRRACFIKGVKQWAIVESQLKRWLVKQKGDRI